MTTSLPRHASSEWVDETTCELQKSVDQVTRVTHLADHSAAPEARADVATYPAAEVASSGRPSSAGMIAAPPGGPRALAVEGALRKHDDRRTP